MDSGRGEGKTSARGLRAGLEVSPLAMMDADDDTGKGQGDKAGQGVSLSHGSHRLSLNLEGGGHRIGLFQKTGGGQGHKTGCYWMLDDEDGGLDSVEAAGPRRTSGFSIQSRGRLRLGGRLDIGFLLLLLEGWPEHFTEQRQTY